MKYFIIIFISILFSADYVKAQRDLDSQGIAHELKSVFYEVSFLYGVRKELNYFQFTGTGIDLNLGYRFPVSENSFVSLLAGLDVTVFKENSNVSVDLGSRYSIHKGDIENYIDLKVLLFPTLRSLETISGFNISIGRKFYKSGTGLFLAYDNYFKNQGRSTQFLRAGFLMHKKAAIFGSAIIGGLVGLVIIAINSSQ